VLSRKRNKPAKNHPWKNWDGLFGGRKPVYYHYLSTSVDEEVEDGEFEVKHEFEHLKNPQGIE
jgi:hypothetical protein